MTKGKIIPRGTVLAGRRSKRAGEPRESGLQRERKRGTLYPDISRHGEREGESDGPGACTACDPVPDGSQPGCLLSDGVEKRRAVGKKWRISEKTLFLPAVLGGALGGLLGMRFFHHKTRHWYFRWGFPLLLVVQLLLVVLALRQAA